MGKISIFGGDGTEVSDINVSSSGSVLTLTPAAATDLVIDNTNASGSTIMQLGTDDANTDFQIQNNSAASLLTIDGTGLSTFTDRVYVNTTMTAAGNAYHALLAHDNVTTNRLFYGRLNKQATNTGGESKAFEADLYGHADDTTASYRGLALWCNDNGGGGDFNAIYVYGNSWDRFINTALMADGTTIWEIRDNAASALNIQDSAAADYLDIVTATSSESISFGNATTNPDYNFLGTGTATFNSSVTFSGASVLSSASVLLTDSTNLILGTGLDFTMNHDGTNTVFDNTFATGDTIFRLGADTNATSFIVQNNGTNPLFQIDGDGDATLVSGTFDLTAALTGTDISVNSTTTINNASSTNTGLSASITQDTTSRSSGTVTAASFAVTGLSTDAGGTYRALQLSGNDATGAGTFTGIYFTGATGWDNVLDFSNLGSTRVQIRTPISAAFEIHDGTDEWLAINTSSPTIAFGNATDNPIFNFLGSGTSTFNGTVATDTIAETTATNGVTIDGLLIKDNAITPNSGASQFIDLTNVAAGEGDIVLADNLAPAFTIRENSNLIMQIITTDTQEHIDFDYEMTTTSGVTSGTELIIGGLAYTPSSVSSAVTNTTTETLFDRWYTMPANTLDDGPSGNNSKRLVKIKFWGIATSTNSTDTLRVRLYIGGTGTAPPSGGTTLIDIPATDVSNNDIFAGEFTFWSPTQGVSGTIVGYGGYHDFGAAASANYQSAYLSSTTIDTTGSLRIGVSAEWSVASASNSCRLDGLVVEIN